MAASVACEFPHPGRGDGDGGGSASGSLSTFEVVPGVTLRNTNRFAFGHVVAANRLSVLGGTTDSAIPVEQAPINADNTLGDFISGPALHDAVISTAAVSDGHVVFVLGGQSGSGDTTEDQCASIAGDGTLSAFGATCPALTVARSGHGAALINGFVFVFGGSNDGKVDSASLSGGTMGPFGMSQARLLTPRQFFATVVVNRNVYVIGGNDLSKNTPSPTNTIEIGSFSGQFGQFVDAGIQLVTPRSGHAAVALGGMLYVIGGINVLGNALDTVEAAPIHDDGTLGAFATLPDVKLQTPRAGHSADVIGNSIYVVGGVSTVERATLQ
jgi:hypothetical protein